MAAVVLHEDLPALPTHVAARQHAAVRAVDEQLGLRRWKSIADQQQTGAGFGWRLRACVDEEQ
ncbi:hypothetical protein GQ85_12025 [Rhodococcus rhodochrous]|nr:hypothetical protein GQ85_12025 [Rhodococcus rhodochrous]